MKCPACGNIMIVVEHDKVELDYCTSCLGVWFDTGELELLLETTQLEGDHLSLDNILTSPEATATERKRKCPTCGTIMKKATVGHDPEVIIDVCPRGDGLWFDSGEVGLLIKQLPDKSDSQGRVINFLGEVFSIQNQTASDGGGLP